MSVPVTDVPSLLVLPETPIVAVHTRKVAVAEAMMPPLDVTEPEIGPLIVPLVSEVAENVPEKLFDPVVGDTIHVRVPESSGPL